MHIACAADETYAPYCAAMLHSLFTNHPTSRVTIHFLHAPGFSSEAQARLKQLADQHGQALRLHEIPDAAVAGLPEMDRIPRLMWYRVLLPALLSELDRILYLDADTLIVNDLRPLWNTGLDGYLLAAVANVLEPALRHRPRVLGMPSTSPYFNSGVLLLNLAEMRAAKTSAQILNYARQEGSRLLWPDQDALNVILASHCRHLHPRWNCQNTLFYWPLARKIFGEAAVDEATSAPAILHFEGPGHAKPWHYLNDHPFRTRYWEHLRATPFPVPVAEGRTLRNIIRKFLR